MPSSPPAKRRRMNPRPIDIAAGYNLMGISKDPDLMDIDIDPMDTQPDDEEAALESELQAITSKMEAITIDDHQAAPEKENVRRQGSASSASFFPPKAVTPSRDLLALPKGLPFGHKQAASS